MGQVVAQAFQLDILSCHAADSQSRSMDAGQSRPIGFSASSACCTTLYCHILLT